MPQKLNYEGKWSYNWPIKASLGKKKKEEKDLLLTSDIKE